MLGKLESRVPDGKPRRSIHDKNDNEKMVEWLNEYTESSRVQTLALGNEAPTNI